MARFAIGDLQGCATELRALLEKIKFKPDRDRLWFVGDLVNRGPESLECLRLIQAMGDNAIVVLGNHDLHLLARGFGSELKDKPGDTLAPILRAPDRESLLGWLLEQPLAYQDPDHGELLVHAGLLPQWTAARTLELAQEVRTALRADPSGFFDQMYGDKPDAWSDALQGIDRLRFITNVLTRLRLCTAGGRVALKAKGRPQDAAAGLMPWFEVPGRASRETRIVFGHWSTLGYLNAHGVIGLDTGCVWGGALTAVNLDVPIRPISLPCPGYQEPGKDG